MSTVLLSRYNLEPRHRPDFGAAVEAQCESMAAAFNQSAISMHRALFSRVHAARLEGRCPFQKAGTPVLSVPDVGHDGTHVYSSPLGDGHLSAALAHWLHRATQLPAARRGGSAAGSEDEAREAASLASLVGDEARRVGHCLKIKPAPAPDVPAVGTRESEGERRDGIVWSTQFCRTADTGSCEDAATVLASTRTVAAACPFAERGLAAPPLWFFCEHPLGNVSVAPLTHAAQNVGARKLSPGAVAIHPGATLRLKLTVSEGTTASPDATRATRTRDISLLYLRSYEHMGVATVACADGCACNLTQIDAHAPSRGQLLSSFETRTIHGVTMASRVDGTLRLDSCTLVLRVTDSTRSGEHKFKVRQVVVSGATHTRKPASLTPAGVASPKSVDEAMAVPPGMRAGSLAAVKAQRDALLEYIKANARAPLDPAAVGVTVEPK